MPGDRAELLAVAEAGPLPGAFAAPGAEVQVRWAINGTARAGAAGLGGFVAGASSLVPQVLADLDGVATLVATTNSRSTQGPGLDAVLDVAYDFSIRTPDAASTTRKVAKAALPRIHGSGPRGSLGAFVASSSPRFATSSTGADAAYQSLIGHLAVEARSGHRHNRPRRAPGGRRRISVWG